MPDRQSAAAPLPALPEDKLREFIGGIRGRVLKAGDESYDEARRVQNGMIDRHPGLIVQCSGAADVIAAVNFARDHWLLLSVRGGGHNVAGNAVNDGGIVVDLSRMRGVHVDAKKRTARAQGGALWADLDRETQVFGLATPGGLVSTTGVAGLTLHGGMGHLRRPYGLSIDNLLSVDIVTADGQLRTASATENPDLFWAVRGAGSNFGVVTSFQYQLHPVGLVLAGQVVYPFKKAKEFLTFYRDFSRDIPEELHTIGGLATFPEVGPVAAAIVCYNGPVEEGEKVLRPLREFGSPLGDDIRPMPYTEIQQITGPMLQAGRRNYIKSIMVKDIGEAVIDTLVEYFTRVPSPFTLLVFQQLGN